MNKIFSIALDGPAGAGKSSVAKAIAAQMGAVYLDTGAMYRTMGLYMDRNGIDGAEDIAAACEKPVIEMWFDADKQHMMLDGEDVTAVIRSADASMLASKVGTVGAVRARLVQLQREFAAGHSVVMDGRDIGTDVLPDATLKIFLTASPEERARRRVKQSGGDFEKVLADIIQRDYNDSHRAVSPMRQAEDAILVDTSDMTEQEVIDHIIHLAEKAIAEA
ncbi:MAG: (d)CMP kinase [Clostridia bacterium]|nr:(d)CMP kinase [Clostridia bacterium]